MVTEDTRVPLYPFDRWNYTPVLPLVYNDALSYIETLGQFADKLNEVIEALNGLEQQAVDIAKAYTDAQIEAVKGELQTTLDDYSSQITEIREEVETFKVIVRNELNGMQAQIDTFSDRIEAESVIQRQYTDLAITQNNDYILEEVSKGLINLKVLNYFTGQYETVQEMFDYLANLHAVDAITVTELVTADKTVNGLIALNMDMSDLAIRGKTIITA